MKENSVLSWLGKTTKRYQRFVVLLIALEMLVSGLGVCYALVMKRMVDKAVAKDSHGFVLGMCGFGLLVISQLSIRIITRQVSEFTRSSVENTLKKKLFDSILRKDYGSVNATHSEEWMNRLTSDTAICANGMTDIVPGFLGMMIRLVGSFALIFWLQPQLAFIIIPGGIVFLLLTVVIRKPIKRFHKKVQEKDGSVRVYLQERISSMLVVRTFGVEDIAIEKAADKMEIHRAARMQKAWISNICNSGFSLAINGMYLLGMGYCGYGIIKGVVSFGTLTAIIQLMGQLQSPLSSLGGYVPRYYTTIASAERLMEVEQFEDVDVKELCPKNQVKTLYESKIKEFTFDHVSFQYGKETDTGIAKNVLNDVSFRIQKGDYVAITGTSGCGKSTMLKLLMGVYQPQSGTVHVNFTDGTSIPIENMKRLFAYVPQGNFLMGGSIRDVITFGQYEPGNEPKIKAALRVACGDFVYGLPMELDTILGEKGAGLSEGQMQRIAIARAIYADCPVLVLDESTSALDERIQQELLENLKQLTDKTVLLVSHRLKALSICNRHLHFEDGNVQSGMELKDIDFN